MKMRVFSRSSAPLRPWAVLALLLGAGCDDETTTAHPDPVLTPVFPVVDPARSTHYFDMPFPSDALLTEDGTPDLTGYPVFGSAAAEPIVEGWRSRLEQVAQGFGNNTAAYFRFTGPVQVPPKTDGSPYDPVLLVDMETGERIPLDVRFITDPGGDPSFASYLLSFAPQLGHPPRSGARLAAVVMPSAGVSPAEEGVSAVPDGVTEALALAGVTGTRCRCPHRRRRRPLGRCGAQAGGGYGLLAGHHALGQRSHGARSHL